MGTIPYALSVSRFVNKVGSDAGFAAFIGLAILVLLYFAQARESATLRDHAADAAERIRQLEARINQLLRSAQAQAQQSQQIAQPSGVQALRQPGPPQRVAAGAVVGGPPAPRPAPVAAGPQLIAPAGVGAPALTAATKLIPTEAPAPTAVAPAAPVADGDVINGGGSNGHGGAGVQAPPRPAPVPATGGLLGAAGAPSGPPRVQIGGQGPSGPRRPSGPSRPFDIVDDEAPSPSPLRRILVGIAALTVLAVIVVVLISATGSGGGTPAKAGGTPTTNAPSPTRHRHHGAAVVPANVNVAVLNGTASSGLAKQISTKLSSHGYQAGCVANALSQTQATTQVAYFPAYRRDAAAVAKALGLPSSDLAQIAPSTQSIQCSPPQPPITNSNVVVTVGADLAGTNTGAATSGSQTTSGAATSTSGAGTGTGAVPPTGTATGGAATGTGTNPTSTVG